MLGRRTEGNSICGFKRSISKYYFSVDRPVVRKNPTVLCYDNLRWEGAYESVVVGQEHCDTSVYLANSQGDQHLGQSSRKEK